MWPFNVIWWSVMVTLGFAKPIQREEAMIVVKNPQVHRSSA